MAPCRDIRAPRGCECEDGHLSQVVKVAAMHAQPCLPPGKKPGPGKDSSVLGCSAPAPAVTAPASYTGSGGSCPLHPPPPPALGVLVLGIAIL